MAPMIVYFRRYLPYPFEDCEQKQRSHSSTLQRTAASCVDIPIARAVRGGYHSFAAPTHYWLEVAARADQFSQKYHKYSCHHFDPDIRGWYTHSVRSNIDSRFFQVNQQVAVVQTTVGGVQYQNRASRGQQFGDHSLFLLVCVCVCVCCDCLSR
jgi:hypothetical protein